MRYAIYFILIIINFIFQTTLFENVAIMGIKPNIMLIITVSFSFMRGQLEGFFIGLFTGILIDTFFSGFWGLNTILFVLTSYLSGYFYNEFYKENWITPFLLIFTFTIFYEVLFYLTNVFLKGYPNIFYFLGKIVLPEAFYTSAVSIFFYKFLYYLNLKLDHREYSKRKFY